MPIRPCLDCGKPTEGSRCDRCRSTKNRERDQQRGSSHDRGYGPQHQAERERWAPVVASGAALCAEVVCLKGDRRIHPDAEWHLAHDRTRPGCYLGPAHARCNEAEGGRHRASLKKSSAEK